METATPAHKMMVTYDKLLLFGDSLTELSSDVLSLPFAITPALQHYYFRKLAVVARGYGGYTSEHLRHILIPTIRAETAAGENVRLLVIEIGTNDAAANVTQHVPVEKYIQNLAWMVKHARAEGVERIVIVGPGPVDEEMLEEPVDKSTLRNLEYSDAAKQVAKEHNVPFIDLWHAFMERIGWNETESVPGTRAKGSKRLTALLTDGVHFSGDGYGIWYRQILMVISQNFPELEAEKLPMVLPHIYNIDRTNLPQSLWQQAHID